MDGTCTSSLCGQYRLHMQAFYVMLRLLHIRRTCQFSVSRRSWTLQPATAVQLTALSFLPLWLFHCQARAHQPLCNRRSGRGDRWAHSGTTPPFHMFWCMWLSQVLESHGYVTASYVLSLLQGNFKIHKCFAMRLPSVFQAKTSAEQVDSIMVYIHNTLRTLKLHMDT